MGPKHFILVVMILAAMPQVISAEGRCPAGMFETGSRDYLACAPIPRYDDNAAGSDDSGPPPAPKVWERRWGAIAREIGGGSLAGVNGFTTEAAAKQAAISQCQLTATVSKAACKLVIPYFNQCAAYAWGEGSGGWAVAAADLKKAEAGALSDCKAKAGTNCEIFYSGCSLDELVPK